MRISINARGITFGALLAALVALQFIAITNWNTFPNAGDDTDQWRLKSMVPIWNVPGSRAFRLFQPFLIQPGAPLMDYLKKSRYWRSKFESDRSYSYSGVLAIEREMDALISAFNSVVWVGLLVAAYRVASRWPPLRRLRFPVAVSSIVGGLLLFGIFYNVWISRYSLLGGMTARLDARRGVLAFYLTMSAKEVRRQAGEERWKRNWERANSQSAWIARKAS